MTSEITEAMLPCPFCGGRADRPNPHHAHGGMVSCQSCGAEAFGPKWNRRALASQAAQIASLSAKVAEVEREREANRWNTQFEGEDLLICENNHEKGEPCEYERWVRVAKLTAAEARAERLEEALWVIASRNKSRDQLQEMARAALQQEGESDE